jgi:hypothetical protein
MYKALSTIYKEHVWINPKEPMHTYNTPESQRKFFEKVGPSLGVKTLNDWYTITKSQIEEHGGEPVLYLMFYRSSAYFIKIL